MSKKDKMTELEVQALVNAQRYDALAATQSAKLTIERERAEYYYLGEMDSDMPVEDGRSKAVSTDVADTIEGLMPNLMDIFCGSDEVVKFEPVGPGDEKAAQQETDYVNHVFMQRNDGFMVLYAFLKDALLSKTGVVKVWWEEGEREEREAYYDLTEDQFQMLSHAVLMSDGKLEMIEHTEKMVEHAEQGMPPMPPQKQHDVTILRTVDTSQARVIGLPPEEFGIDRNARCVRESNYCFHEIVTKTKADLKAEGFDEDQVDKLPEYTGWQNMETLARDSVWEHATPGQSSTNSAAQVVRYTEHYVRMDYEGSGKPRLYQVVAAADDGEILYRNGKIAIEEWDVMPFAACTPVPISHRFFGRSMADLTIPIQRQKTALLRGFLDNMYLHNNSRTEVSESHAGPNTLDDLMVSRPGGIVRTKMPGGLNVIPVQDVTGSVLPGLQYMDSILESRTGIAKQSQGIDANALQNQSATAVAQVFSASQMRMKLIARCLAEGVKDIFWLLHQVIQKHGNDSQQAFIGNQWVQIDPRDWKTRDHMTIHVGLGNGSKAQQFAQLNALANIQKEFLMGGKSNMVDDTKLFNMASAICKVMGHASSDVFFNDPAAKDPQTGQLLYPPPQPQPDPKVQIEQMKAQTQQQITQSKMQLDQAKAQVDFEHQRVKTMSEIQLAQEKARLEAQLSLVDAQMKREEHQMKAASDLQALHHQQMAHEQKLHHSMQSHAVSLKQQADKKQNEA